MTQVILKPHALHALLGLNASAVTNQVVGLHELFAGDLNARLIEAKNGQERLTLLTGFLVAQLQRAKTRDRLVEESLRVIHHHRGSVQIKYLLEHLHLSERQFERRFTQTVGLSPQSYLRVKRFNEAARLMNTGQFETLADVAYALNFYDQSHFIRDIKAFSGITPKGLSGRADAVYTAAGYSYL